MSLISGGQKAQVRASPWGNMLLPRSGCHSVVETGGEETIPHAARRFDVHRPVGGGKAGAQVADVYIEHPRVRFILQPVDMPKQGRAADKATWAQGHVFQKFVDLRAQLERAILKISLVPFQIDPQGAIVKKGL